MEPKWGPIGVDVYNRTYRRVKENGENEQWHDTVRRVVEGNTGLVADRYIEPNEREKLFELISEFKMLPAGRHLWVSGVPGRQFLFNCHRAAFTERLADHFTFTFDELMKGGGVGANYSLRYIDVMPKIESQVDLHIVCDPEHPDYAELVEAGVLSDDYSYKWDGCFRVPDTREGWVEALRDVLTSATQAFEPVTVVVDVSIVRGRGEPIRGFGGTASGPKALAEMLMYVNGVLNEVAVSNRQLTSLECMTIDHYIAECVVAGNVRRSARMSIKSWKDADIIAFIQCKADASLHWSTNISVEIDDEFFVALKKKSHKLNKHAQDVYKRVVTGMLENGEPGFYNISLASEGELGDVGSTNPCGEIALEPWENCNLGHINVNAFVDDFEGSKEAFRLMARFLIRATFGDVPNPLQREVVDRNRRIGVGFFGFQGWLNRQGIVYSSSHSNRYVRKTLRDWKAVVDKACALYARELRIPVPIKNSTLAPTGSIANLPGETASGQTCYAPWMKRRVRYSADDPQVQEYIDQGYHVEDCIYSPNTKVVTFYVEDPLVAQVIDAGYDAELVEGASDVSLGDMLAVQAMFQECYADNAVSFTVNIEPDAQQVANLKRQVDEGVSVYDLKIGPAEESTVDAAAKTIIHYLPHLKGTTIMVDGSRPQAPLERITQAEFQEAEYAKEFGQGELACSANGCPIR